MDVDLRLEIFWVSTRTEMFRESPIAESFESEI